jgi:hypothetical protein
MIFFFASGAKSSDMFQCGLNFEISIGIAISVSKGRNFYFAYFKRNHTKKILELLLNSYDIKKTIRAVWEQNMIVFSLFKTKSLKVKKSIILQNLQDGRAPKRLNYLSFSLIGLLILFIVQQEYTRIVWFECSILSFSNFYI